MAVTLLDTPAFDEATSDPSNFTVSAGSNRWLILMTSIRGTGDTMDSVTYGGQSMTLIHETDETNQRHLYVWGLNEAGIAAASSTDFVASYSGSPASTNMSQTVLSIQGASQTAPSGGNVNYTNASTSPTTTALTGGSGSFGVALINANNTGVTWSWNNSWTEIADSTAITANDASSAYRAFDGTANEETASASGSTNANKLIAAQFDPVAASGSYTTPLAGPTLHGGIR